MMRKIELCFFILFGMYLLFLKIFCYINKGNLKMVEELLKKFEDFLCQIEKEDLYLNYIMFVVVLVKLGNFGRVLQYYCLVYIYKKKIGFV